MENIDIIVEEKVIEVTVDGGRGPGMSGNETLGENIAPTLSIVSWDHTYTFADSSQSNPNHFEVSAGGIKHKTARSAAGYRDRLSKSFTLNNNKLYKVTWEISNYVSGGFSVDLGGAFSIPSTANGVYTDYILPYGDNLISIQAIPTSNCVLKNLTIQEVLNTDFSFSGKLYAKKGLKTNGLIEIQNNHRILIGNWADGVDFGQDSWHIYENSQPSISIGNESMKFGTGVCIGSNAGKENNTLGYITAVGINALRRNTSGHATAFGTGALQNNTTSDSHAFGDECLSSSVTGINNGFGYYCLNQTTGTLNSSFGHESQRFINGNENTSLGHWALKGVIGSTGSNNCAVGTRTLENVTTSISNVAVGNYSLNALQTDGFNVAIGLNAMADRTSGWENVAIGPNAGRASTGSNNIFIGRQAGFNSTGNNNLYIDVSSTVTPLIGGNFADKELKIGGMVKFSVTYPPAGTGVTNGSMFYGTDGALYFKGGAGTVTKIANN